MAHHVFIRPLGDWSAVTDVLPAWMTLMDQQLFGSIDGDAGGTWAPALVITIGGAGMDVEGPLQIANTTLNSAAFAVLTVPNSTAINVTSSGLILLNSGASLDLAIGSALNIQTALMTIQNGAICHVQSGGEVIVDSGGLLDCVAGSTTTLAGAANSSGAFTFISGTWPLCNSRTVTRRIPMVCAWGTVAGFHVPPQHNQVQQAGYTTQGGVAVDVLADNSDFFYVVIPPGCVFDGGTLSSVTVQYLNGSGITSPIHGSVVKIDVSGNETTIGASTAGTTTAGNQTFTVTVGVAIDHGNFEYRLRIQCPLPAGGPVTVNAAYATNTITDLRV